MSSLSEAEQERQAISKWTANRRVHDWLTLFCAALLLTAAVEVALIWPSPLAWWGIAAAVASGWAANRMHQHVLNADHRLKQLRKHQLLHAALDKAFDGIVEQQGIRRKRRAA